MEDLRWPHFSFHALEMLMELGLWEGLRAEHLLGQGLPGFASPSCSPL